MTTEAATRGKRAQQVAETYDRLIDGALGLFVERGFAATSIEDIAAVAGIGRSSFFRYFDSKEAVVFAPMLAQEGWFFAALRGRPEGEPLLASLVAVCVEGEWPQLRRTDMKRVQIVLKREPAMVDALNAHIATTLNAGLVACLRERAPAADEPTVKAAADLAVSWIDWGIRGHIRDGRPMATHCREAVRATAALTADLGRLTVLTPSGVAEAHGQGPT